MATLLLVEDNEALCDLYKMELEEEGHAVLVANDGMSGLKRALSEDPDLVIMDINLPENIDGLESMSRILGRDKNIPVIIYTAYSRYRDNFLSWAAEEYVVKSGDTRPLKQAIKRVLEDPEERDRPGDDRNEVERSGGAA